MFLSLGGWPEGAEVNQATADTEAVQAQPGQPADDGVPLPQVLVITMVTMVTMVTV